jgi:hypothetical protein
MPYVKGRLSDSEFASGFTSELATKLRILQGTEVGHWRPTANLGPPFGSIEADAGVTFSKEHGSATTMLIVEREASSPGNERNILKWYQAVRHGHMIDLKSGNRCITPTIDDIILLLCFARADPSKWADSDFRKTVQFCSALAGLVSNDLRNHTPSCTVRVDAISHPIVNWQVCGSEFGSRF